MGLVFNAGDLTEVNVSQYVIGSWVPRGGGLAETCNWLIDQAVPFNIMKLVNEFRRDNTHNTFVILKRPSDSKTAGFHILQSGDVITVKIASGNEGSMTDYDTILSFNTSNPPASFNVYFIYNNSYAVLDASQVNLLYGKVQECYCQRATLDNEEHVYGNKTGAWRELDHFNYFPGDTIPRPYNPSDVCNDTDLMGYVPNQTWQENMLVPSLTQFFTSDQDDLGTLTNADGTDPEPMQPDNPFDPSDPQPYNPSQDDTSDLIDLPTDPPLGITSAGFINVYNPGIGSLQGLGDILFPNVASATDIVDAVVKLCETLANQNLINYVIDCHIIPVTPTNSGNDNIKVGFRNTGISVPKVASDYVNFSCGSLSIQEFYGGFQDYLATKSKLFLPMIGFVDVLPEFWQSGTISVDYKFNVIDGSFMCYVRSVSSKSQLNGSVIAQYGGNACIHLPLTGVNYANMVSGLIQSAIGVATGGSASAVLGTAVSAANTFAQGGDVQQSNGYNSTTAMLGVRTPYLMIERLKPAWSTNYKHDRGLPSNIATQLQSVSGFTVIEDIDLTGLPFTQTEIEELRGLLKDGVYF